MDGAKGKMGGNGDVTVGEGGTRAARAKAERESVFLDGKAQAAAVAAGGEAKGPGAAGGVGVLPLPNATHWSKHGVSGVRDLCLRPLNAMYLITLRRYHVLTCID